MAARLAAASFIFCAAAAPPQTLYVSSSRGDDAAAGDTPAAPWRTLTRAARAAPALAPGSAGLLRRGDEWAVGDGGWALSSLAGTAEAPIAIADYADGGGADRPRLVRAGAGAGPTVTIDNSSGVAVRGLEIVGGENGVAFTYDAGPGGALFSNFSVDDCFFSRIHGLNYNASSGSWWGAAVAFAAHHAGVHVRGVRIAHNIVNDSDVFYSNSLPSAAFTRALVSELVIEANAVTGASYNTVFLDSTSFVSVTRNVFLRDTPAALFVAGTTDIIMGTLNSSVSLTGNEISYRGEYQPGGPDGCAIDFETNATGVTLEGNYIAHSYGAGIMVFGHQPFSNRDLRIVNNTLIYNGCLQTRGDRGGIAFMHANSSGVIAGNVLATCPGVPLFNDALDPGLAGWTFSDNAIDGVGGVTLAVAAAPALTATRAADGALRIAAASATAGAALTYTTDGSRPTRASPAWPAAGIVLAQGFRATAVFVKAFPPGEPGVVGVESASAGGVFAAERAAPAPRRAGGGAE